MSGPSDLDVPPPSSLALAAPGGEVLFPDFRTGRPVYLIGGGLAWDDYAGRRPLGVFPRSCAAGRSCPSLGSREWSSIAEA